MFIQKKDMGRWAGIPLLAKLVKSRSFFFDRGRNGRRDGTDFAQKDGTTARADKIAR